MLCQQAKEFRTTEEKSEDHAEDRVQVIILHAQTVKAELAWATVTNVGLEIDHSAIDTFKLSQKELVPVPDLVNYQLRNFKLTKWLGHGVLLWTLVNWAELPMEWVNKTAIFMGGKPGHSNLFYGPMVISVFKQDMVDLKRRTLDHTQMRTLRQVADYIQMVDDNPCVPNPVRFESIPARMDPLPDLVPIPGVKINDGYELELMASFGMTASMEGVSVAISHRGQEQCAAAVPFILGLKWYTRSAKLDLLIEQPQVADRVDGNLAWFQWTLDSTSDASTFGQQKASAKYAHHDRSLVIIRAGGAPICIKHIEALTAYLEQHQATERDRAELSKEGFQKYWKEKYTNDGNDTPSPFDLETAFPENLVEEDADEMMASVMSDEDIKDSVLNMTAVRVEGLVKRLLESYKGNEQVVNVVEALI